MRKKELMACAVALALSACGGTSPPADAGTTGDAGTAPATAPPVADTHAMQDKDGNPVPLVDFDITGLPVSTATLGELPFFSMPAGYAPRNRPHVRTYARFPFRIGDGLHWVEGASWNAKIGIDSEHRRDKEFSERELRRNFESVLAQAGAQQVFDGPLLRNAYYGTLEDEIGGGFIDGVNMDQDARTTVHVIRQADRNVWVQLSTSGYEAGLVVVDERPFVASARWTGEFPYLAMPGGYDQGNRPKQRDFDMYPFWTGDGFEEVEGRTWSGQVRAQERGYSMYELARNLDAMVAEAGGQLVFAGRIPESASERYDDDFKAAYSDGTSYSWDGYDSRVYRTDLPDGRQVWVHARLEYLSGGWVVVEREGFRQTAALLQADALKQQLDADGRVAIQVHFAVDEAAILPESQPQIDQVLALLEQDPTLRLAVEGHTDSSGGAERNRALSQARAESVAAALVARGIATERLSAAGYGPDRPVADNGDEAGRARNRRVELVRRD